jgi:diguanylate cyclase (GGDEF)-like protein
VDLSVFTSSFLNANATISFGVINCALVMVLALIQSRIIEQHSKTLFIFAAAILCAGLSLLGYLTLKGDSHPLAIIFSCFGILTFSLGMSAFLSLYNKANLIKAYALPLTVFAVLGLFAFSDLGWKLTWTIATEGLIALTIAVIAFKQKDQESPIAKLVVAFLSLFIGLASTPWMYALGHWLIFQVDVRPAGGGVEHVLLGLAWTLTPTVFYSALVVAINVRLANALKSRSEIDHLTGLANRRALYSQIENSPLGQENPEGFGVILLDIDHFKAINDTYGHLVGDQVLVHCAKVLSEAIRPQDLLSRYGGEEFCVVAKGINKTQAIHLSERLCNSLRLKPMPYGNSEIKTTVSVGVVYHDQIDSLQRIIAQADSAMYAAKASGRNKVCVANT